MLTEEGSDDGRAEPCQRRAGEGRRDGEMGAARPQLVQADRADRPLGGLGLLEVNRRVRVLGGLGVISPPAGVQNVVRLPRWVQIEGTQKQDGR